MRAIVSTLRIATLLVVAATAAAHAQSSASGRFDGRSMKLDIGGAYSYWDGAMSGNGRVIKVAVSNAEFKPDLIDQWVDRGAVIHDLFANEQVKVVHFDFDPDGKYRGYSYYFGSGDGCGYCYDSSVRSTVRVAGGMAANRVARCSPITRRSAPATLPR